MELTITQNGTLYAMQHQSLLGFRSARRRQAIARQTIRRATKGHLELSAARKNKKKEKTCFI
jgi:hypothetical protein